MYADMNEGLDGAEDSEDMVVGGFLENRGVTRSSERDESRRAVACLLPAGDQSICLRVKLDDGVGSG